jgi:urease accessory protein
MLHLREVVTAQEARGDTAAVLTGAVLTLTFDERRRSRLLVALDDGREAALLLPRGTTLRHGDRLRADEEDGLIVEVRAATESLSIARTADAHLLTRAAYHLGNRHVPLQIGDTWVAYIHDHVLDDLVRALGLAIEARMTTFEPEAGAFQHDGSDHHRHEAAAPHHHDAKGEPHHH